MKMNLTGLADFAAASEARLLDALLTDIRPDPDQPRTEFDQDKMAEITETIRQRGVKTPISVRRDPQGITKYIINLGERRYLGSKAAGKLTIPALVDEDCNSYDQVIENLQRDDLTPMELARFIQGRLGAGDKKGAIAKGIGKPAGFVTFHLALIDPPAVVLQVYATGVTSPQTLYDLRNLHAQQPQQVDAWVQGGATVTRDTIRELAEKLFHEKIPTPEAASEPAVQTEKLFHEKISDQAPAPASNAEKLFHEKISAPAETTAGLGHDQASAQKQRPATAPAQGLSQAKRAPRTTAIMVEHGGRMATVQQSSVVRIVYEGSTEVIEVVLSEAVVVRTVEVPN